MMEIAGPGRLTETSDIKTFKQGHLRAHAPGIRYF
jgi:hypothetical protein